MNKATNKIKIDDLKRHRSVFKYLDIFIVTVANLIFSIILFKFYKLNLEVSLFFILGLVLSFIILRPEYILSLKYKKNKTEHDENFEKIPSIFKIFKLSDIIIVLLRILFFGILKSLFMVTIIWSTLVLSCYYLDWIDIRPDTGQNSFLSLISLIGIFSGIFHFYFRDYKSQEENKIKSTIGNYMKNKVDLVSEEQFLEFLEIKKQPLYSTFEKKRAIPKELIDNVRNKKHIYIIPSYKNFDDAKKQLNKEDKKDMEDHLATFFRQKYEKVKKDLEKDSNQESFIELKKRLILIICFSEEALIETLSSNFNLEEKQTKEKYRDYLNNFTIGIYELLLNNILFGDITKEEKAMTVSNDPERKK